MSCFENDENISDNKSFKKKWLLVQWIGSFPQDAYDIINIADVVFDEFSSEANLQIGSAIMVRCGKIKSHASVLQISDNTDALYSELRRLQRSILSENSVNVIKSEALTPKIKVKKRKFLEEVLKTKQFKTNATQTSDDDEKLISKLMQENQKLKAELYEANKIINSMCKDLNTIVQGAQKKMLNQNADSFSGEDMENTPPRKIIKRSSPHSTPLQLNQQNNIVPEIEENDKVLIGTGRTAIPRYVYNQVNWLSFTAATRKLLMAVFSRDVLATHSLTGKPSPAFIGSEMPVKMRLDASKVSDIVEIVATKCGVSESMVRSAITTKCADENKMFKKRLGKCDKLESSD